MDNWPPALLLINSPLRESTIPGIVLLISDIPKTGHFFWVVMNQLLLSTVLITLSYKYSFNFSSIFEPFKTYL